LFEDLPTGKLYYPIWAFYSVSVSSMIHFFIYFFNDIKCFSVAIVRSSITYVLLQPWPIVDKLPFVVRFVERRKANDDYHLSILKVLHDIGHDKSKAEFEEAKNIVDRRFIMLCFILFDVEGQYRVWQTYVGTKITYQERRGLDRVMDIKCPSFDIDSDVLESDYRQLLADFMAWGFKRKIEEAKLVRLRGV
jgi:hypothetical protein